MLLAGCGSAGSSSPANASSDKRGDEADVGILNSVLDIERMAVAAYEAGATHLKGAVLAVGKRFLSQEAEHVDALVKAIKAAGGKPDAAKPSYGFPRFASQTDVLNFAVGLENTVIAAYLDALPKLSSGALRATAASILTDEAEHVAVLLGALGKPQAPAAFVTGQGSG